VAAATLRVAAAFAAFYEEPVLTWALNVGCDFSGFFVELLGLAAALDAALEGRLAVAGPECDVARLSALFSGAYSDERGVYKSLTARRRGGFRVAHGLCGDADAVIDAARLMVEREYGPGRDEVTYACARRARAVWAPTAWAADQFVAAGIPRSRVSVVAEAVDARAFSPAAARADGASAAAVSALLPGPRPALRILSVFKWEHRKGYDTLLAGYFSAFEAEDDVELVVHTYKPPWEEGDDDLSAAIAAFCENGPCAPVRWLGPDPNLSRRRVRALYHASDVFALPTRGEGWGLPIHEAAAMGLPIVATNFSGPAALLSSDTAYLLDPGTTVDGFADPRAADVAAALRDIAANRDAAKERGAAARRRVASRFSPAAVAAEVVAAFGAFEAAGTTPYGYGAEA